MHADVGDRTWTRDEIRAQRLRGRQVLALGQRKLAALDRMAIAAAELEYVERAMEALNRGEDMPEQDGRPSPADPGPTGKRALAILMGRPGEWLGVRDVLAGMNERGWVDTTPALARQTLRHALRRLAERGDVERRKSGQAFLYRYVFPAA